MDPVRQLGAATLTSSLNRRRFLGLGGGLAASALLSPARLGAAQTDDAPVVPAAAAGDFEEQSIRVFIFSGPEADAHTRLAHQFTEYTQGKIQVTVEEGGRGPDYDARWLAAMQAGSDAYDVLHSNAAQFLLSGPAGFFEPLEPFMENADLFNAEAYNPEDFPQALLALFQYEGQQYLLPQEASTLMFFYRRDILEQYGIPEPPVHGYSWEELQEYAITIQDGLNQAGDTDTYALLFGVAPPSHAAFHALQPAWSTGHELITDDFEVQIDHPAMVDVIRMMTDFLFTHEVVSPGVVGYEYPEVLTAYQQGRAAMALQWNAAAPTVLGPDTAPEIAEHTGFAVYPYDSVTGPEQPRVYPSVHAIGVSRFSQKKEAAFAYVAWFTSQAIARDYVLHGGGSSGRASLLSDPSVLEEGPQYLALLEGFEVYHPFPQFPGWQFAVNDILGPNFGAIWTEQFEIEEGLQAIQRELEDYLEESGVT